MKNNYKLTTRLTVLLCFVLGLTGLRAQVNTYTYSQSMGTYTPITGGTAQWSITSTARPDDNTTVALPLGFTFSYGGVNFTTAGVSNNGMLVLGGAGATDYAGLNGTINNCITPLGDDLSAGYRMNATRTTGSAILTAATNTTAVDIGDNVYGTGIPAGTTVIAKTATDVTLSANATTSSTTGTYVFSGGGVRTEVLGVAPNQIFVAQWTDMSSFGTNNQSLDFQVRLYEGTNVVEIVYGECYYTGTTSDDATVGLRGASAADFNNRNAATDMNTSIAGTTIADLCFYNSTAFVAPSNGLTMTWTPSAACAGAPLGGTTPAAISACAGSTASMSATGATTGPGISYQWQVGTVSGGPYTNVTGGTGATTTSYTTGILTAGVYYYVLQVTCSAGPTSTLSTESTVTVNAAPSISVTPNAGGLCPAGTPVALTASGTSTSYAWLPTAGLTPTTGANVSASPAASTTYTVTGTDGNGCTATATAVITLNSNPTLTATATPASICTGGSSQLLATASIPTTYTLSNPAFSTVACGANPGPTGDDAMQGGNAIGFNFDYYGTTYTQFGISTNGNIQLGNGTGTPGNPAYSTAFTDVAIPNTATPNNMVALAWDDWLVGAGEINWGVIGTAPNRQLVVCYNTTGRGGGSADTLNGQIVLEETTNKVYLNMTKKGIQPLNTSTQGIEDQTGSASSMAVSGRNNAAWSTSNNTMVFTPVPNTFTYTWTPGTFLSSTTVANPMASAVSATTTYTVTVASSAGCTSTASATVTVDPLTSASNITPASTVCSGVTVTLNSTPAGGGLPYTYAWVGPNSFSATTQNPTVVASALSAGTYTVTVTDACASTSSSTVTLTVNALPAVAVTPTAGNICMPGGAPIALAATGATTFTWLPTTALTPSTGANVSAAPTVSTTYTVTGTDGNGCTSTAVAVIAVNPNPTLTASATPGTLCTGDNSQLLATASLPVTYAATTAAFSTVACGANPGPTGDDAMQGGNAIGFNFDYYGTTYTQFGISTNGNIQLGNGTGTPGNPAYSTAFTDVAIPNTATPNNMVALAWDDWLVGAGEINWGVIGTAPNRQLVVCYNTTGRGGGSADTLNGQIVLEETTNKIYLNVTKKGIQPLNTATQGIEDQTGSAASQAVTGRNNVAWNTSNNTMVFTPIPNTITYAWSPATYLSSTTVSNPMASAMMTSETYTVVVTSVTGCTSSSTVAVTVNPTPTATATTTPILCNAGTSTVTVSATGGTPSYTGTGTFTASAGAYSYTVTDVNGCASTATGTITEPTAVAVTSTQTPVACFGGTSTVTLTTTGGTPAYTGDGVQAPQAAGTTVYTVTDNNGCTGTTSVTVTEPTAIAVTPTSGTIMCNGGTAAVSLTATGGTPAYTGDGVQTPQAVGTTVYTVTDANGCTGTASVTLTEPTALVATSSETSPILCFAGSGTITVSATGGTPSYTGAGAQTSFAGTNTYTVTDANGCVATTTTVVTEPSAMVVSYTETGILCNGGSSSVTISVTGGTPTYAFPFTSGSNTFGQTAGTQVYTVTDANGCTGTASVTVTEPAVLTATATATGSILCNGGTAPVDVVGTGGTTPYSVGTTGTFNQSAGTTVYTVTDANGCSTTASATLTEPTAVMVMTSYAPIMCNGDSTAVTVTAMDGTPSYTGVGTFNQAAGTVTYSVTDANGCLGATNVTITEPAAIANSQSFSFCGSGSVTVGTNTYTTSGVFTDVLTAANSCDSTVTTTIAITVVDVTTTTSLSVITANSTTGTYQWINCGTTSAIAGETNQSYTATADGSYAVEVTDNGCVDTSACVMIIGAGIADNTMNVVEVYPNPTLGAFNIAIANANASELMINIVDIQGKEVFSSVDKNVNGTFNKQVNIENIAKGVYYIKVNTGAELKIEKLVIQ